MSVKRSTVPSKILVSACLLGEPTRYDGGHVRLDNPILERWKREARILSVCPEVEGGCPIPRPRAEVSNADGNSVVTGKGKVINIDGQDVTDEFMLGAQKALRIAQENGITTALLKARSPSCGSKSTYDGTFSNCVKLGQGATAALLARNGIRIFNEYEIEEMEEILRGIDIPDL